MPPKTEHQHPAATQGLPPGSVWADLPNARPVTRIAALEKARNAAMAAGAPEDAVAAMDRELTVLRAEAANSRPLGARLDSAKAKLAKAENKVQSAELSLEKAMRQLEEAREQRKELEQSLAELQKEVPQQSHNPPEELLRTTKLLLDRLETGRFAATAGIPEDVISAMTAVHKIVEALEPTVPATLIGPLEPESSAHTEDLVTGPAPTHGQEDAAEDDVMGTLDGIDECDDSALLAIARRLKRARRT